MSGNTKKELVLCDYCQIEKDGTQIYTARKHFAGCKIIDILQKITQCTIPPGTRIKLCSFCASTLHATTGTIDKAVEVVTKLLPTAKNKGNASVLETVAKNVTVTALGADGELSKPDTNVEPPPARERKPSINVTPTAKTRKMSISTPQKSPTKGHINEKKDTTTVVQPSPRKQTVKAKESLTNTPVTAAPSTPKKEESIRKSPEDSLHNAIKLTPAKDVSQKKKDLIKLFGPSADSVSDTEEEEDDDDVVETVIENTDSKNIDIGFDCKLCDFTSTNPNMMKKHLKELHGQKRPRIYNCMQCIKSFGVIKSLKAHLLTHGIVEQKEEKPVTETPLAVLTALKPNPKPVKNVANSEYTFAINGSNSSTPKPAAGEPQEQTANPAFVCEICQEDLKAVRGLKHHLKMVHGIERPKAFKCDSCDAFFMYKVTMVRHFKKKHGEQNGSEAAPAKIKARRKTIASDPSAANDITTPKATQTNAPPKIKARRKTVAVERSGAEQPPKKVKNKLPAKETKLVEDTEDVIEVPIEVKAELLNSPNKAGKLADSPAVNQVTDSPKKLKKPTQVLITSFGLKLNGSTNNKTVVNDKQETATPSKVNEKADEDPSSATPNKKNKSKKKMETDTLDASQILSTDTPAKEDKAQTEDSSQISTATNGTPKKAGKRKADRQLEQNASQEDTAEEGELADESINLAQLKPVRKSKSDKPKQLADSDIELLDEINLHVKPHKRTKLDSMELSESELSCSMCNKVVGTRKRLDSHMHKKHATQLKCPICKVLYTDNLEYIRHFTKCDSDDGLPCGIKKCTKVFSAANFLSNHLNKKHKTDV